MIRMMIFSLCVIGSPWLLPAEDESSVVSQPDLISAETTRTAIEKALPFLERGSRISADERTCFTCHNQALPVFALTRAASLGFDVDQQNLTRQVEHTWKHLHGGKDRYAEGRGQGGQVMTAGYALWTLDVAGHPPDDVTNAVTHYLLEFQQQREQWVSTSKKRPPSAGSDFTATYLALRALHNFGTAEQAERIHAARESAGEWLSKSKPADTEDLVFQLRSLSEIGAESEVIQKVVTLLLTSQHADGGWSQTIEMDPDAYATATVLSALRESGNLPQDHRAIVAGTRYLLDQQLADGTWHVTTHADPIQEYYESGFPHAKDQFISITATSWAVLALSNWLD